MDGTNSTPAGPILDLESLRKAVRGGQSFTYRLFYGHTPRPDGKLSDAVFSQFWPCSFSLGGIRYIFAEQWMMASKARLFADAEALARILVAKAPLECKRIGRSVRGFDEARWREHRFDLVTAGNVAKFGQDAALREYLLATGDEILVEASPTDCIWGIRLGRDNKDAIDPLRWRGQNLLGFALMRARLILRGELPPPLLSPVLLPLP
jgi:ribA/ribD-fused uncharacterized protein